MVDCDQPHVVDRSTLSCWSGLLCSVLSHFRQHPFFSLSITLCVCSQCLMGVLTWIPPPFSQHHLVCLFSVFDGCPYSGYPLPPPSITLCVCSQCLVGVLTVDTPSLLPVSPCVPALIAGWVPNYCPPATIYASYIIVLWIVAPLPLTLCTCSYYWVGFLDTVHLPAPQLYLSCKQFYLTLSVCPFSLSK